jgi:hypothetical protein
MEKPIKTDIENQIFTIRGKQVMLDRDVAELFKLQTKRLNEQVKRNVERFPEHYFFRLTTHEKQELVANCDRLSSLKHSSAPPLVFTEYGISMLATLIKGEFAAAMSVTIIDTFIRYSKSIRKGELLATRLDLLEANVNTHQRKIDEILALLEPDSSRKQGIFFENQIFDAYAFFSDIVSRARKSIILIDNYIDHTVLLQLAKRRANVSATIYTERISATLQLDLTKHNAQYQPIEIQRINQVHDRFLIIDEKELYHVGASIKDLGKKWFAFSRMDSLAGEVARRLRYGDWGLRDDG